METRLISRHWSEATIVIKLHGAKSFMRAGAQIFDLASGLAIGKPADRKNTEFGARVLNIGYPMHKGGGKP